MLIYKKNKLFSKTFILKIFFFLLIFSLINAQEDSSYQSLADCQQFCNQPQQTCQSTSSSGASFKCVHDGILPLKPLTIVGFIAGFGLAICSCLAGIGGGVFNILIGLILFQMTLQQAAPFSITVVVISMSFRFFYQLFKKERHPEKNQPIVNYSLSAMIAPSLCAGSLIGVKANKVLPEFLVSIIFVLLMIYCIWTTQAKYKEIRSKELASKKKSLLKKLLQQKNENGEVDQEQQLSDKKEKKYKIIHFQQDDQVQFKQVTDQGQEQDISIREIVYDKNAKGFLKNGEVDTEQKSSEKEEKKYKIIHIQEDDQVQFRQVTDQGQEQDISIREIVYDKNAKGFVKKDGQLSSDDSQAQISIFSDTQKRISEGEEYQKQNIYDKEKNLDNKLTQVEEDNLNILKIQIQQTQIVAVTPKKQTASFIQKQIAKDLQKMKKVKSILGHESKQLHLDSIFIIAIVILVLFLIELFRGSSAMKSIIGVPYCQLSYWILAFIYIPIALLMIFGIVYYYKKQHHIKVENDYQFHETDIQYTNKTIIKVNCYGFFVGTMASLLGIGGGVVLTPLIHTPSEASYTSCFITLYLSLVNFILYILLNSIIWEYSLPYGVLCLLGFIIGQRLASYIKKIQKQSLIILMLQVAIVIALVAMFYDETVKLVSQIKHHQNFIQFKSLCTAN